MNSSRFRVLFVSEAVTLAHVARPLALASALEPGGFEVHFACDVRHRTLSQSIPAMFHPIRSISSEQFLNALAHGKPLYSRKTLEAYIEEDRSLIQKVKPDLIVGDFRLSLAVSAPLLGCPYATITNIYWSPYAQVKFPIPDLPLTKWLGTQVAQYGFDWIRPLAFAAHSLPLNILRRRYGLPWLGLDIRQIYTWADFTLYSDLPGFLPTRPLPPNHRYLGPISWSMPVDLPKWWKDLSKDETIVYVNLGSSGNDAVLPALLEALGALPVTTIVATAGRSHDGIPSDRIFFADFLPAAVAAKRADLVVCNGGSPSTYQALTFGKPVLGIPSNLDQLLNMHAVTQHGAGIGVRALHVTVPKIRIAVETLLRSPGYRSAARQIGERLREFDAGIRFKDFLREFVHA